MVLKGFYKFVVIFTKISRIFQIYNKIKPTCVTFAWKCKGQK